MVSTIYPASHYGCCMRHLGENIRNNFHNSKAAETLERIGFHTWSRAFCPGNRYNIMTSNIAESVNSMFDVEREFLIVARFDEINRRFALLFHQRRIELVNSANRFVPSIEKDISKYVNAGNKLLAHQIANYKFSVTSHGDVATVTLVSIPYRRWSIVRRCTSFLKMCRASRNLEALYRKGVFDFFNRNDPTALGMINQAADGGHIGASYVLAIISIFNGGVSMREGLMFIANMKKRSH
ncbi:hypothetical protein KY290_000954 [Solanum tuberosum]|uniref:At2g35280-like TPR domain-containing protein n=1 Tax=Solanum tuberosum TaxID=4113 RepID=A0ABQ7WKR4_SOLTU|nr:hypothetical protein KY290_000954 [Solanum tuberosum]